MHESAVLLLENDHLCHGKLDKALSWECKRNHQGLSVKGEGRERNEGEGPRQREGLGGQRRSAFDPKAEGSHSCRDGGPPCKSKRTSLGSTAPSIAEQGGVARVGACGLAGVVGGCREDRLRLKPGEDTCRTVEEGGVREARQGLDGWAPVVGLCGGRRSLAGSGRGRTRG